MSKRVDREVERKMNDATSREKKRESVYERGRSRQRASLRRGREREQECKCGARSSREKRGVEEMNSLVSVLPGGN